MATGLTNAQFAQRLVISTKGVGYHFGNIFAELGAHNHTELAALLAGADAEGDTSTQS